MKKVITATVGAALISGALLGAGAANASSETNFLSDLNYYGFDIYNANQAVNTGYQLCSEMQYDSGAGVADRFFVSTPWSEVVAAADNLCPEVW